MGQFIEPGQNSEKLGIDLEQTGSDLIGMTMEVVTRNPGRDHQILRGKIQKQESCKQDNECFLPSEMTESFLCIPARHPDRCSKEDQRHEQKIQKRPVSDLCRVGKYLQARHQHGKADRSRKALPIDAKQSFKPGAGSFRDHDHCQRDQGSPYHQFRHNKDSIPVLSDKKSGDSGT